MKQLYFLFILLFFISFSVQAQKQSGRAFLKSGNISLDDLKMSKYDKDTSAAAVILYDAGRSRFDVNNTGELVLNYDRHLIIKILKKSGYDWANISVPLYQKNTYTKEAISNLKANTYNLVNGKIVATKLTDESVFEEKNTYNWVTQKFTMPNVKEGSVIEFTYRIQSKFIYNLREWQFQYTIPVVWSEYTTQIPNKLNYSKMMQGYNSLFLHETKPVDLNIALQPLAPHSETKWAMKDVPAIREEPFMSSINNYCSKIEFQINEVVIPGFMYETFNNTWEKISTMLMENSHFGDHINKTAFTREKVVPLIKDISDPEKKMVAIYKFVQENIKYNNIEHIATKSPIKKTLETKTGNSAEINLLLIAMLREAGLTANPVILSTRDHGFVNTNMQANLAKFNYVIGHVQINEKEFLLDATEPFALPNLLPIKCVNGEGRLLTSEGSRWVSLAPPTKSGEMLYSQLTIGNNNSLKGKIQLSSTGYVALSHRNSISRNGEDKFIENFRQKNHNLNFKNFKVQNSTLPQEALKMDVEIENPGQAQKADIIYLSPFQDQAEQGNPFKLENRLFPIDFGTPIEQTYIFNYTLPEGFRIDEQPKNVSVTLPDNAGKFVYSINYTGNTLSCVSKISINRAVFMAEDYALVKEFFNQVAAKHSEQIVLKKL
ncbi:transglutaminase domain-containing protein [Adhaeribacter soli]|uniref:DUF3857 domain-containing protein n=1 Tax=Adhaeribacter soli TaxID=2607655 RepID=A0A5N1J7J8_9BACT|nr:DUF3857 domain-containing protein [Adhaeribacter soli]KAA9340780.1 DUF3857 domain-containing protein [Adhaeribacter soli]